MARLFGLPAPTTHYTVERGLRIPMRDGVDLMADHYAPTDATEGTLLVRVPYGRGLPLSLLYARLYAARGYHVVMQSVRGTSGSGGVFEPFIYEHPTAPTPSSGSAGSRGSPGDSRRSARRTWEPPSGRC